MQSVWCGVVIATQVVFDMEGLSNLNSPDPHNLDAPPFPIIQGVPLQPSFYGGAHQC
jgi:hypothetical protein